MPEKVMELMDKEDKTPHEKMLVKAITILGNDYNWGERGTSKVNGAYCLLESLVAKDEENKDADADANEA